MGTTNSNLRKAAVLMRSLDAEITAALLAQLSPAEAAAIRGAMRDLGPVEPEEQADVFAEFRRVSPRTAEPDARGVELELTPAGSRPELSAARASESVATDGQRFKFLERASVKSLAAYLAREHAQTIAVVLSHLPPERAASVLAALPEKLQANAIERLSALGETEPEILTTLEHELADWAAKRTCGHAEFGGRRQAIAAILAAADVKTRGGILANLNTHNPALADQISDVEYARVGRPKSHDNSKSKPRPNAVETYTATARPATQRLTRPIPSPQPLAPRFDFDQLIDLDGRALAAVLSAADSKVLALALTGSQDKLVDRICEQMPKRIARTFRRELRQLGPTRLSDVEAAQNSIAEIAATTIAERRRRLAA